jgi:hypothetical protein
MEAVAHDLALSGRYTCDGCGAKLPFTYPACIRCGQPAPAIVRLREASLRLRLLVLETQARRGEEIVVGAAAISAEDDVEPDAPVEGSAEELPEPIPFRPIRTKRAWLGFGFLRKAS